MALARQKPKKGARPPAVLPETGAQGVPSPPTPDAGAEVGDLLRLLAESKQEFAAAYLLAREQGSELGDGRRATADDARMWARRNLAARGIPDSEVLRWRLALLIGAPQVGED